MCRPALVAAAVGTAAAGGRAEAAEAAEAAAAATGFCLTQPGAGGGRCSSVIEGLRYILGHPLLPGLYALECAEERRVSWHLLLVLPRLPQSGKGRGWRVFRVAVGG